MAAILQGRRGKSVAKPRSHSTKVVSVRRVTCDPSGSLFNLRLAVPVEVVALRAAWRPVASAKESDKTVSVNPCSPPSARLLGVPRAGRYEVCLSSLPAPAVGCQGPRWTSSMRLTSVP